MSGNKQRRPAATPQASPASRAGSERPRSEGSSRTTRSQAQLEAQLRELESRRPEAPATIGDLRLLIGKETGSLRAHLDEFLQQEFIPVKESANRNDGRTQDLVLEVAALREIVTTPTGEETPNLQTQVQVLRTDVNQLLERAQRQNTPAEAGEVDLATRIDARLARIEDTATVMQGLVTQLSGRVEVMEVSTAAPGDREPVAQPPQGQENAPAEGAPRSRRSRSRRERRSSTARRDRRTRHRRDRSRSRDRGHSSPSSSPSSGSESETSGFDSEDSGDSSYGHHRGGVFARKRGKKFAGLKELRPTNRDYEKLLSYRYYRLKRGSGRDRSVTRDAGGVREWVSSMRCTLRDLSFDGVDGIKVLDFLARFVGAADSHRLYESQAYLVLPYFLKGLAHEQYTSMEGASSRAGGIRKWPEAIHYLLRSYATNERIQNALYELRGIAQKDGELEDDYSTRLNRAEGRCGNPHSMRDRITHFINGLLPTIGPIVGSYREENPRCSYLDVVSKARSVGQALRASTKGKSQPLLRELPPQRRTGSPHQRPVRRSTAYIMDYPEVGRDEDAIQLMDGNFGTVTPSVPSHWGEEEENPDGVMYGTSGRMVPNAHIPYSEYNPGSRLSRPGWVDRRPRDHSPGRGFSSGDPRRTQARPGGKPLDHEARGRLTCHSCYRRGHLSPECLLPLREFHQVIANYEALTEEEKARVPATSYWRAKSQFTHDGKLVLQRPTTPTGTQYPDRPGSNTQPRLGQAPPSPGK